MKALDDITSASSKCRFNYTFITEKSSLKGLKINEYKGKYKRTTPNLLCNFLTPAKY